VYGSAGKWRFYLQLIATETTYRLHPGEPQPAMALVIAQLDRARRNGSQSPARSKWRRGMRLRPPVVSEAY
jgi:hypothetical protein